MHLCDIGDCFSFTAILFLEQPNHFQPFNRILISKYENIKLIIYLTIFTYNLKLKFWILLCSQNELYSEVRAITALSLYYQYLQAYQNRVLNPFESFNFYIEGTMW